MEPEFVGLNVSKARIDVAVSPTGERWHVSNDREGLNQLITALTRPRVTLIVAEATGGYEVAAVTALALAGLPIVVVNPRQVRDFARATGQLAKTDALDAAILALFAERVRPALRELPSDAARDLTALVGRRHQLLDMLLAERARLATARPAVRSSLRDHVRWLERQLRGIDAR